MTIIEHQKIEAWWPGNDNATITICLKCQESWPCKASLLDRATVAEGESAALRESLSEIITPQQYVQEHAHSIPGEKGFHAHTAVTCICKGHWLIAKECNEPLAAYEIERHSDGCLWLRFRHLVEGSAAVTKHLNAYDAL